MFSFLWNIWRNANRDYNKTELLEQFESEQSFMDAQLGCARGNSKKALLEVRNDAVGILEKPKTEKIKPQNNEQNSCFQTKGVITQLREHQGIIDNEISFDVDVTCRWNAHLKVGSCVEYLAFRNQISTKAVKILKIIDKNWDEQLNNTNNKRNDVDVDADIITYFKTQERNVLGIIKGQNPDSIVVETDYNTMNIKLKTIKIGFSPKIGDRISINCIVQTDCQYIDQHGEILSKRSVEPTCIWRRKCTITKSCPKWYVLNDSYYLPHDILPSGGAPLQIDEVIDVDLIECEKDDFRWRCIKFYTSESPKRLNNNNKSINKDEQTHTHTNTQSNVKNMIHLTDKLRVDFSHIGQKIEFHVNISNSHEYDIVIKKIEIHLLPGPNIAILRLKNHDAKTKILLPSGSTKLIHFESESIAFGTGREVLSMHFDGFVLRRTIVLNAMEDNQMVGFSQAKENASVLSDMFHVRKSWSRSRAYANQVWSEKSEIVPGIGLGPKRRFISVRIGNFEVPDTLRSIYLKCENHAELFKKFDIFSCLQDKLTITNYRQKFHMLIYLEEMENYINFRKYDMERGHFTHDGEYLSLTIDNLAERRPSLVIGDSVRAFELWREPSDSKPLCYVGVIHKVLFNSILLKFNPSFHSKYCGEDYRLIFNFSRFNFRKQHFATNKITEHLGKHFLFPVSLHERNAQMEAALDADGNLLIENLRYEWYNTALNIVQKRTICNVLRGEAKNMAYVIFGPPGSGKTVTLVEAILQTVKNLPNSRLLVGTPSNSAADLITTLLIKSDILRPGDFVRLLSQNIIEKGLVPEHLAPYCATVDVAAEGSCINAMTVTKSGIKLKCQKKFIGRHRITISTCQTLGNLLMLGFPNEHFTHVFIDESGQCTEPDVMLVISQVSLTRGQVVLAGDPHQLQSIVVSRIAEQHGLSVSYLQRLIEHQPYEKNCSKFPKSCGYNPKIISKLVYNYRALPSILHIYNNLFYDSELIAQVNDTDSREANGLLQLKALFPKSEKRSKAHGAFFYGIYGENLQDKDSPSWYNPEEAREVFSTTLNLYKNDIKPEDIGIIAPYMRQVKYLRNLFLAANVVIPKVGSVEEFQGQERDIILISTVRSTENVVMKDIRYVLGFVESSKRMNVAISRARYLMIVFGNPHVLMTDKCWRTYIQYCLDNDAYMGCDIRKQTNTHKYN